MKNNLGHVCVEFNKTAVKLFNFLYKRFEKATDDLHAKKDEDLFVRLNNQYLQTLKQQLHERALSLLEKYKIAVDNFNQLNEALSGQINFYLNEFSHKSELFYLTSIHSRYNGSNVY